MPSRFSALGRRIHEIYLTFPALYLSILALGFYAYTLAPSMIWADGARMQMDVMLRGSSYAYMDEVASTPTDGLPFDRLGVAAWDHPVYVMLGQLFLLLPFKNPVYRINFMSAVMAALTIGVTYHVIFSLIKDHWATAIGSLALMVSHTFWFHAVTAEVYTLNTLFIALLIQQSLLWAERQTVRSLLMFSLIAGLGTANHRLFPLVVIPAFLFMIVSSKDRRQFLKNVLPPHGMKMLLFFIVGYSPWWIQFIRMARLIGAAYTWELAGTFSLIEHRLLSNSWSAVVSNLVGYLGWLAYQFTPLGLWLGILGIRWGLKTYPAISKFFLGTLILHVAFSANFSVADRFDFHLPSYWIFSAFIAFGAKDLQLRLGQLTWNVETKSYSLAALTTGIILLPIGLYAMAPPLLKWYGITERDFGVYPIGTGVRDTARYFLNPNKRGDDSAEQFGISTMNLLAPNALVITPKTSEQEAYILLRYYQRVRGMRPDVQIDMLLFTPINNMPEAVSMEIRSQIACRAIYITSLNPKSYPVDELEKSFKIIPEAHLFRVLPLNTLEKSLGCPPPNEIVKGVTLQELIRRALRWP